MVKVQSLISIEMNTKKYSFAEMSLQNQSKETLMLQSSKPLCYSLPENNCQDSLPFIDGEESELKSKVLYLIKSEQVSMQNQKPINVQDYIKDLYFPEKLSFVNSQKFEKEVKRVEEKLKQPKNKNSTEKTELPHIDKQKLMKGKTTIKELREKSQELDNSLTHIEQSKIKNCNLQISKFFNPDLMKSLIQAMDNEKRILDHQIQRETQEIEEINKLRKYEQLEAQERQSIVQERLKVMVHKKRKID